MATPNYAYEKRQRELAKKRKKEEKAQRKTQPGAGDVSEPALEGDASAPVGSAAMGDRGQPAA